MPIALDFILLAALWGASFLFMRMGAVEFGAVPTAGLRVAIAAVALLPVMLSRGLGSELRRNWRATFVCGVLNSALPFFLFSFAVLSLPTGIAAILNATTPLFGALVAWLWLGERPGRARALGLAIGFVGVALLSWSKASLAPGVGGIAPIWGVAASLAATLSYAVAASYTRRYLSGRTALMTATGSQLGAAAALALPTVLFWPARMPGLNAWLALLALGVLCTAVAYVLYFRLIEQLGASRAITVTFVIPVFAVFYGTTLLGEALTLSMVLCGAIVLVGTALATGVVKLRFR